MLTYDMLRERVQEHGEQLRVDGSRERLARELRPPHARRLPSRPHLHVHVPSLVRRHGPATGV